MLQPSSLGGKSNGTIMFSRSVFPTPPASCSKAREYTNSFSHSHLRQMTVFVNTRSEREFEHKG